MPQLSLYIDDDTMNGLRKRASLNDESLSKYVVRLIKNDASDGWPEGYWSLFGSVSDDSFSAPADLSFALDAPRGSF